MPLEVGIGRDMTAMGKRDMKANAVYEEVMKTLRDIDAFAEAGGWTGLAERASEARKVAQNEFAQDWPATVRIASTGSSNAA